MSEGLAAALADALLVNGQRHRDDAVLERPLRSRLLLPAQHRQRDTPLSGRAGLSQRLFSPTVVPFRDDFGMDASGSRDVSS